MRALRAAWDVSPGRTSEQGSAGLAWLTPLQGWECFPRTTVRRLKHMWETFIALASVSPTSTYVVWALDASVQLVQQSWLSMLQRLAAPTIQPGVAWEAATGLAGTGGWQDALCGGNRDFGDGQLNRFSGGEGLFPRWCFSGICGVWLALLTQFLTPPQGGMSFLSCFSLERACVRFF